MKAWNARVRARRMACGGRDAHTGNANAARHHHFYVAQRTP